MKPILSLLLLSAAMFQQKCDPTQLASPDSLRQAVKEQSQPYFPDAKVLTSQKQHAVVILTCARGFGFTTINKIGKSMSADPESSAKFDEVRAALSPMGYDKVGIVFDNGEIWYRFEDRAFIARYVGAEMLSAYRVECGFSVE
jgi:hypothetical protein